jgi:hypothetical protein
MSPLRARPGNLLVGLLQSAHLSYLQSGTLGSDCAVSRVALEQLRPSGSGPLVERMRGRTVRTFQASSNHSQNSAKMTRLYPHASIPLKIGKSMLTQTTKSLPSQLYEYFTLYAHARVFRRHAVFTYREAEWSLVCCTVEYIPREENATCKVQSRSYPGAMLYEDYLTGNECIAFASEIEAGQLAIDSILINRDVNPLWTSQRVPILNNYMSQAGFVVSLRVRQSMPRQNTVPLLAPNQPYYPDIHAAAHDWLPLRMYYGDSDDRNGQVIFLLRETKAFISTTSIEPNGTLVLSVSGSAVEEVSLVVQGAAWTGSGIHHLMAVVEAGKATLGLPVGVDRLEYFLIDHNGATYDFHVENRYTRGSGGRSVLAPIATASDARVHAATTSGEGQHIEFKPFINAGEKLSQDGHRTKLYEVLITVAAFANADGGCIFLGIDDSCQITGIEQKLAAWGRGASDDALVRRYIGAVLSAIKDNIEGEVNVDVSHARLKEGVVVMIDVAPVQIKAVNLAGDCYLYVRSGASNRKVAPNRWPEVSSKPFDIVKG